MIFRRRIMLPWTRVMAAILVALTTVDDLVDALAVIPTMPDRNQVQTQTPTACPHEQVGLISFDTLLPSEGVADIHLPADTKVLFDRSATIGTLTIPAGAEFIVSDEDDLTLTTAGIVVHGALRMGSASCSLRSRRIGIVLTGSKSQADLEHGKGIVVHSGGVLAVHGKRWAPTWTRLGATATQGSHVISLQQAVNWEPGQSVAVITTQHVDNHQSSHQNEERNIVSVAPDGRTIELDVPLAHEHYGGPEYAAEVALLSRNIFVEGDEASEGERFGGHTMCKMGSSCSFSSVEARRMGQENIMARYPFHFHMMDDVTGTTYAEDCAVHRSYFRAFTVHGTHKARISRNVAYDISGSAFYLEDGVEEENLFEFNLAAFVHLISKLDHYGSGQEGVTISTEDSRIVPTDATAVGFYCTNAKNRWVGNSASGGFSGFHFPQVPRPLGDSAGSNYQPDAQELLEFNGNTAHSSGSYWSRGSCVYVGGALWEETPGSHIYSYTTGRITGAHKFDGRKAGRFRFENTKVFACHKGVLFWDPHWSAPLPNMALVAFEAYDVQRSSSQLGFTYMSNAIIVAHTANAAADLPQVSEGFELYDTDTGTILADVEFRNFDRAGDVAIMDMTHSNIFKQQGMFAMRNVTFNNVPTAKRFRHVVRQAWDTYHHDLCQNQRNSCPGTAGASQTSTLLDVDGVAQGPDWTLGPAIMGGDDKASETNGGTNNWWLLDSNCQHRVDWGFFVCPTYSQRAVVSLFILTGLHDFLPSTMHSRWGPEAFTGTAYHFGRLDRKIQLGLAGSPMVTGPCCDIGWYVYPESGTAAADVTMYLDQMVAGPDGLIVASPYPLGATFQIQRCISGCSNVQQGNSLQSVLDSAGDKYFVDSEGRLFLKLVDESNTNGFAFAETQLLGFKHRYSNGGGIRYKVHSDFSGSGQVSMSLPDPLPGTEAPTLAPAPGPLPPTTLAPGPLPPISCQNFCDLYAASSCKIYQDAGSCVRYYFKSGEFAMPCKWLECGHCYADGENTQQCPDLTQTCLAAM